MTTLQKTSPSAGSESSDALRRAQSLLRAGELPEAERLFREVWEQSPGTYAAVSGLIKILEARGSRAESEALLRAFVAAAPSHANVLAAARHWEQWEKDSVPGPKTLRIALTGTGTLQPLGAHLRVACGQAGLSPSVYVSDFNQWAQDLLPGQSALYEFGPELIVLLIEPSALFPRTLAEPVMDAAELETERTRGLAQIRDLILSAQKHAPGAAVVLHTFALPDYSPWGILDLKTEQGQRERIQSLNDALVRLVRQEFPQTVLFDQDRVESRHGKERTRDARLWYLASMPFSETFLPTMAREYMRLIRPLKGLSKKCLVLDLDNTLWGGVIGEDGIHQIKLGGTAAPGNAFADFQKAAKALSERGILLALCSKNNPEDVWPVLDEHPEMVLRRKDFAAMRINWRDKATNIAEIAQELNIGLDSLVFFDDNPAERGLVRQQLPEVLTVELPADPALYTQTLLGLDVFEVLSLTEEDKKRARQYQEQQERKTFEEQFTGTQDLTAYLRGLEIVVTLEPATPYTLPRIAQLVNKTNQFNTTTRRLTEAQVQTRVDAPDDWIIRAVTVRDRFGDSGLTGVAFVRTGREIWEIDSFLLSCRVLGRGVEDALLTTILEDARAAGATHVRGLFIPTAKNAPAAEFYAKQQFQPLPPAADGAQVWELALSAPDAAKSTPEWLKIEKKGT